MKRTLWRALIVVAFLSIVFVVLPVSATFPAPEQASDALAISGPVAPYLGSAASFVGLASSTLTNIGSGVFIGDVGTSPGTSITGFPPATIKHGAMYMGGPVPAQAQIDAGFAYTNLAGRWCDVHLTGQNLGAMAAPLLPKVYCFDTSAQLTGNLVLDAQNDPNAVWIFQIGSTLTTAPNSSVTVINGGQAVNVFWQVGSSATLGTGTRFRGNILAHTSISLDPGAGLLGRAVALNGAVTFDTNGTPFPIANNGGLDITWTVPPTVTQYGPYYLTYKTVITNTTDEYVGTQPITYTLDSDLSLVSLYVNGETGSEQGTVFLSGGTVVLPSGGTVITSNNVGVVITPGGSMVLPDGGTVVLLPDCSLYLAPGGTMLLPGGGVMSMNSVMSWQANSIPPNSVTTMTLVARGVALWSDEMHTRLQVPDMYYDGDLETPIRPDASAGMSVIVRGPMTAKRGEVITYTIAFSNVSTLPVYNVWVTDTLPTGVVPLPGVQTTMFTPVAPPAQLFEYRLPVRVMVQGTTLINRVSVSALGLQLDPIVGNSAFWNTVVDTIYTIYLPVIRY
jgi:uncharacterized repeat protein (TIGR01451 family)